MGLRKINTIGIKQANKVMHLSAMAYNLKKYLKFVQKRVKSGASTQAFIRILKKRLYQVFIFDVSLSNFEANPPILN